MSFGLGRFSRGDATFTGVAADERIVRLDALDPAWVGATILDLLDDWDASVAALERHVGAGTFAAAEALERETLRYHAPIARPGKMLHAGANYGEHVKEMAAYNVAAGNADPARRFTGEKDGAQPYLFLKASSALTGAYDDIALPPGEHQMDWEAELAVVIGRRGRGIAVADAADHIAGYMVTNDLCCRDLLWRADRPNFKTDWLSSKSHDGFAPMGPLFVPRAFAGATDAQTLRLAVNGEVKQQGSTGDMIFSAEEQIAFASTMMTLEPGDIFATGTVGGVGQATGTYLRAGDIVETTVEGLGTLRNRIVAAA
ncbi:fumarylacetoacetate hydrolase family protein [Sphingomonas sp. UYEF23]|uniref:fumarylacetoacetate hydrolase family protein n=1 Tax=Sphingomonas sp. UYEF23 TaxID=1756408 RepID=UPI003395DA5B